MLSGPAAFPVDSECKAEESSWGVIAGLMEWPVGKEGGRASGGTGSGEPSIVWMWEARHSTFWASVTRRAPLLINGKVSGGWGWTIFLKKDQARETDVEKDREEQKEAHAERFSSRITRLH